MLIRIDLAVLLAIIIIVRLRRRTEARSRNDELLTVVIVGVFGILIADTAFGHVILDTVGQMVASAR